MNRMMLSPILAAPAAVTFPILVDSAYKGLVLMLLAIGGCILLRRAPASLRHLVLVGPFVALLALPILSVGLPEWRVVPPWVSHEPSVSHTESRGATAEATPAEEVHPIVTSASSGFENPSHASTPASPHATEQPRDSSPVSPLVPAIALIWALGAALFSLRLLASRLMLARLERRCTVVTEGSIRCLAKRIGAEMGIRRPVKVLLDDRRSTPMTWGVLRPRVLLPSEATRWRDYHLRSVLLHELAHVKRWDSLSHFTLQLSCALHWFNPLVWMVARRARIEQEHACDDVALSHGIRPSEYAESLLAVSTGRKAPILAASIAGSAAGRSQIHRRIRAVLSGESNRKALRPRSRLLCLAGLAVLVLPLSMLRVIAAPEESTTTDLRSEDPPNVEGLGLANEIDSLIVRHVHSFGKRDCRSCHHQALPATRAHKLDADETGYLIYWILSGALAPDEISGTADYIARLLREAAAFGEQERRKEIVRRLHLDVLGRPPSKETLETLASAEDFEARFQKHVARVLGEVEDEPLARRRRDGRVPDGGDDVAKTYRKWLRKALRSSTPYDRFVQEQIACPRAADADGDGDLDLFLAALPDQAAGIGVRVKDHLEAGRLEVIEILPNHPAAKSKKIEPGSRIVAVGQGNNGPLVALAGLNHAQALALLRGARETVVRVEVLPPGTAQPDQSSVVVLRRVKLVWTQKEWEDFASEFTNMIPDPPEALPGEPDAENK